VLGRGFYFAESASDANRYAGRHGAVVPAYLDIKNPLEVHGAVNAAAVDRVRDAVRSELQRAAPEYLSQFRNATAERAAEWVDSRMSSFDFGDEEPKGIVVQGHIKTALGGLEHVDPNAVLAKAGFDGVHDAHDGVWVAFEPSQVHGAFERRAEKEFAFGAGPGATTEPPDWARRPKADQVARPNFLRPEKTEDALYLTEADIEADIEKFDPNQARDERGRWTDSGETLPSSTETIDMGDKRLIASAKPMSHEDAEAILRYNADDKAYIKINAMLRSGREPRKGSLAERVNSAVNRAATDAPPNTWVWRGIRVDSDASAAFLARLQSGDAVTVDGLSSGSLDPYRAYDAGLSRRGTDPKDVVLLQIEAKRGVYVAEHLNDYLPARDASGERPLSDPWLKWHYDEFGTGDANEYVFPHRSTFKLVGTKMVKFPDGDRQSVIQLRQTS
jgi:hypothetical protein